MVNPVLKLQHTAGGFGLVWGLSLHPVNISWLLNQEIIY